MTVDSRLSGNDEHKLPAYSSYQDSGVEQQGKDRGSYGEGLIKQLSKDLSAELGKGFSVANLRNFRRFYHIFPDVGKGYTLCSELSWSHIAPFSVIPAKAGIQNAKGFTPDLWEVLQ